MENIFVNFKSELTAHKEAYEARGKEVFRTRMQCQCKPVFNRRNGILVVSGNRVVAKVICCKACAIGGVPW